MNETEAVLLNLLEPVREQVASLDQQISDHEAILKELQEARRKAMAVISVIDPPVKKKSAKAGNSNTGVSEKTLSYLESVVRTRFVDAEITSRRLIDDPRINLSRPTIQVGLHVLHDRGILRIDRKEGNTLFYRMVGDAS